MKTHYRIFDELNPLRFCLISYYTRINKYSFFIIKKTSIQPFFGEVFVYFASEYFVLHFINLVFNYVIIFNLIFLQYNF